MCSAACRWLRAPWPVAGPDCMAKALEASQGTELSWCTPTFKKLQGFAFFSFTIAFTILSRSLSLSWVRRGRARGHPTCCAALLTEVQELALHGHPKKDECARLEASAAEGLAPR